MQQTWISKKSTKALDLLHLHLNSLKQNVGISLSTSDPLVQRVDNILSTGILSTG